MNKSSTYHVFHMENSYEKHVFHHLGKLIVNERASKNPKRLLDLAKKRFGRDMNGIFLRETKRMEHIKEEEHV